LNPFDPRDIFYNLQNNKAAIIEGTINSEGA